MAATPLYASVGANDLEGALAYYGELLGSQLGWTKLFDNPAGGAFFGHPNSGMFAVVRPFNGAAATAGNGTMIGFSLASNAAVDAFHAKALALGGTDEGAPGDRGPAAYFAYVRDPEGNKLCAFHWVIPG